MMKINNSQATGTTIEQEIDAAYTTTGQVISMINALNQTLEQRLAGGPVE